MAARSLSNTLRVSRQFAELCERSGRPDLASSPDFLTNELRVKNRERLLPELEQLFRQRSSAQWSEAFQGATFPYGPVNTMAEVFADPQVQHSQLAQYVEHPTVGRLGLVGPAVSFSSSQNQVRGPSPTLGQHTDLVLQVTGWWLAQVSNNVLIAGSGLLRTTHKTAQSGQSCILI